MKIKKIYIKNINSLRGEHTIDFSKNPFDGIGLFAIIGATGAGKTTILDAVTLGLFNRIPRFAGTITRNMIEEHGSVLTRGERECAVEITYSCQKGDFTSKWSIGYNRNNNLNDYEMQLSHSETAEILPLRKGQIPDLNQEYIGLTYDQFIKSILLSQGEFAKFLKSNRNDRGKLLEDITGTAVYRQIGERVYQKSRELVTLRNTLTNELKTLQSVLLDTNKELTLSERLKELASLIENQNQQLAVIQKNIGVKSRIAELRNSIEKNTQVLNLAEMELNNFTQQEAWKLDKHEKAEKFYDKINDLKSIERDLSIKKHEKLSEEARLKEGELALSKAMNQAKNILKLDILVESEVTDKLQALKNAYDDLKSKQDSNVGQAKVYEAQLGAELEKLKKLIPDFSLNSIQKDTLNRMEQLVKVLHDEQKELLQLASLPDAEVAVAEKDKQNALLLAYSQLKNTVGRYFQIVAQLKDLENDQSQNQELSKKSLEDKVIKEEQLRLIREEILKLDKEKLGLANAYNFEKNRHQLLHEGEACPLCGSFEHPYLSNYANNYLEIDQALLQKRNEESVVSDTLTKINTQIGVCHKRLLDIQNQAEKFSNEQKSLIQEIESTKGNLGIQTIGNIQTIEQKISEVQGKLNLMDKIIQNSNQLVFLDKNYDIAQNAYKLQENSRNLALQMSQLFEGNDLDATLKNLLHLFTQSQTIIATCENNIKAISSELTKKEALLSENLHTFELEIRSEGFENRTDCESALLQVEVAKKLRDKRVEINNKINATRALISQAQTDFDSLQTQDEVALTLLELQMKEADLKQDIQQNNQEKGGIEVSLKTNDENKNKIKAKQQVLEEFDQNNRKWTLLNEEIGSARGEKYANFAQAMTLVQLVVHSNRRLVKLTDRYLLDKPEKDEDELMVIDQYLGNERRSVKTLSGGETFLISLSLALALSDMASKNIPLESLFIDEGFGTLDPETLDMAISTLEHLQMEGNKNIGIISHVEAIKERISTQIQLEKNSRGFSTLKIQG